MALGKLAFVGGANLVGKMRQESKERKKVADYEAKQGEALQQDLYDNLAVSREKGSMPMRALIPNASEFRNAMTSHSTTPTAETEEALHNEVATIMNNPNVDRSYKEKLMKAFGEQEQSFFNEHFVSPLMGPSEERRREAGVLYQEDVARALAGADTVEKHADAVGKLYGLERGIPTGDTLEDILTGKDAEAERQAMLRTRPGIKKPPRRGGGSGQPLPARVEVDKEGDELAESIRREAQYMIDVQGKKSDKVLWLTVEGAQAAGISPEWINDNVDENSNVAVALPPSLDEKTRGELTRASAGGIAAEGGKTYQQYLREGWKISQAAQDNYGEYQGILKEWQKGEDKFGKSRLGGVRNLPQEGAAQYRVASNERFAHHGGLRSRMGKIYTHKDNTFSGGTVATAGDSPFAAAKRRQEEARQSAGRREDDRRSHNRKRGQELGDQGITAEDFDIDG
tara:strand:+ start:412 stop:1776 length:1365 start_codon:yes stop_codon:yes gene_type:complete